MAGAQDRNRTELIRSLDSIARAPIEGGRVAGVSVAVVQGTDTLLLRGYGQADLELDVPTPDDAVYEIASVTKQFTAAAIMKLVEEGELRLDDDLRDHLPDYPTQGHTVPLRRLLDHTSGIHDYTTMPVFWDELVRRTLPRDTLVALFSAEPFDFAPGAMMVYSSSGYFLLGLIIEKASGLSYEEYVEQEIFAPLGMERSHYCSNREVIEDRAHGYGVDSTGTFMRREYADHTWPYAAGSLCSTAGDLVTWMRALHGGRVLGEAAYQEMITPETLPHGHRPRYA